MIEIAANPAPGINLIGFLEADLGLGEVARKLERSLEHAGVPFAPIVYRRPPSGEGSDEPSVSGEAPYDTNIVCLNADYLHAFLSDVGTRFFANRYSIGVWFWETSVFREENLAGFRFLDEVWVASEYVRQATSAEAVIPVLVAPLPIDAPPQPRLSKHDLGLPEKFTFLFNFDFVSAERKNPRAVVDAFTRAFAPDEGPVLVLKSINGERKPTQLADLEARANERTDLVVLDKYLPVDAKNALVAACDCYVSLHRSEGFGLTMAEAMSYGKPVIGTAYSGNLEFMTEENSYLVPYRLVPIPNDWWAYSPGAEWADPDVDVAAARMRQVWEDPEAARAVGGRAREELLERFSLDRAAAFIVRRLADARERGAMGARASKHDARPPILEASQDLSRGIGESLAQSTGSRPTSFLRRLLHKALWPYLEDQRRFETSVVDALTVLQRSVEDMHQRVTSLELEARDEVGHEPNVSAARHAEF